MAPARRLFPRPSCWSKSRYRKEGCETVCDQSSIVRIEALMRNLFARAIVWPSKTVGVLRQSASIRTPILFLGGNNIEVLVVLIATWFVMSEVPLWSKIFEKPISTEIAVSPVDL